MNKNYVKVQVEGKNINNYLKWLIKQNIQIIHLNRLNHNKLELIIFYKNYQKLKKYSKTYKVILIKKYGTFRIVEIIKNNIYIFIPLIISIMFLYFLSNLIFSVDIFYNDQEVVNTITKELKKYEIEKYKFKKNYNDLKDIKEKILNDNKDTLEWLEIIEFGTKYIVKLVERKKEQQDTQYKYQSITTTKNAIITSIKASSGEKIKEVNDYVKLDEIIVSGILTKPDGNLIYKKAEAIIHGEVWYKVQIEYPYVFSEEKITGKNKDVLVINFLNYNIPIFTYKKFKEFKVKNNKILLESNILPINLSKIRQYEVIIKEEIYTWEEAISNAIEITKKKMLESNPKIISIKNVEILDKKTIDSKIYLELFVSAIEDITKIIEITPNQEDQIENDLQN